jgi:Zn-dependent protease with chaperone function
MIAVYFIRGIQWLLARLFDFLFSKHLSLSRQMEFNADAIAAHVVGSRVSAESLLGSAYPKWHSQNRLTSFMLIIKLIIQIIYMQIRHY